MYRRNYLRLGRRIAKQPDLAGVVGGDQELLLAVLAHAVDVRAVKVLRPDADRFEAYGAGLSGPLEVANRAVGRDLAAERRVP